MRLFSDRNTNQGILWICMVIIISAVIAVMIYTNITLRSIEKNLPNTLLSEINSLSIVLEKMSNVVSSARIAQSIPDSTEMAQLRKSVEVVQSEIVDLRNTYVTNNLVNASAFHAVVAPAIADIHVWLTEGISGYKPNSDITLDIINIRIAEAFQKASILKYNSQIQVQTILDEQRSRLESFLSGVNILFVLTFIIVCCLIYMLIHQKILRNREIAAKNELSKHHHLLDNLLNNLPLGIAVWDQDRNIIHLNKSFTDITGYTRDDMPHLSKWPSLAYPDPEYRQQVREHWRQAVKYDEVSEYRVNCKNGAVKDIEFRATFLPDSRTINTLTDVTARNKNEKALQESRKIRARSKKMESLGLLAGGVAHDLNNILSGIVSYPQLILLDLPKDDKLREPIEIMHDSGRRAAAIVQDLLTVARGVAIEKEPLNINSIIQDYLKSADFKFIQQFYPHVSIDTSLDEDLFNIMGSRVHIRKILMNLISNGYEALEGTGNVFISTTNSYIDTLLHGYDNVKEGEYILLSIKDQGKGISEEALERIFEPFYSKKVMGRSGTGLGLTVVWNVVQDHHGYINVMSSSEGTTFGIYLPITRKSIVQQQSSQDIIDYYGNGELILVVDDISSQRRISSSIIEKLGYRSASVPSGEEAVEYIKNKPVDLILLDMIMSPGINGRETYEKILQVNPIQKAIVASGFAETDDIKETLKLGASQYLKKPLMIKELGIAIKEALAETTNA